MKAQSYIKNGFLYIGFVGGVKDFISYLSSVKNYDDGQGRSHDILDEELHD